MTDSLPRRNRCAAARVHHVSWHLSRRSCSSRGFPKSFARSCNGLIRRDRFSTGDGIEAHPSAGADGRAANMARIGALRDDVEAFPAWRGAAVFDPEVFSTNRSQPRPPETVSEVCARPIGPAGARRAEWATTTEGPAEGVLASPRFTWLHLSIGSRQRRDIVAATRGRHV